MKLKEIGSRAVGQLILIGAVVSGLCVAGCGDSAISPSGWQRLSSAEGGFSLDFPKPPETKKVTGRMNDARF